MELLYPVLFAIYILIGTLTAAAITHGVGADLWSLNEDIPLCLVVWRMALVLVFGIVIVAIWPLFIVGSCITALVQAWRYTRD